MDFDLRQWLLILGPVIIIGVLLHGYLRMRAGQNEIKMQLDKSFVSQVDASSDVDDLSLLKAELPNGGARVISRHEQDDEIPVLVEPVDLPGRVDRHHHLRDVLEQAPWCILPDPPQFRFQRSNFGLQIIHGGQSNPSHE